MSSSDRPGSSAQLAVTHEIRRLHDGSLISAHCGLDCARAAFENLTLAQLMGPHPPGPLEEVEARVVDVATGQPLMFTRGLVPLDGLPPAEVGTWP